MLEDRIFLSPPHMGGNELKYIERAFKSNYIAPVGENLIEFENSIKEYTGCKYAIALSSGTAAIHLALRVLGIEDKDIVLASTFTFIGSISPILYQRATPYFIDSEYKSWNLDPNLLRDELVSRKKRDQKMPKALVLTHLYGQISNIELIKDICDEFEIYLIEDSAESLGATYKSKQSGTFGKLGVFSFNGNKIITTSSGGVLVSDDELLMKEAKFLSTQAKEPFIHYEHVTYGYNYRMSNILAGIGRGQMEVLDSRIARKREIFTLYKSLLSDEGVEFMPELKNSVGNRWLTTILFHSKEESIKIRLALETENIESRPLWKPMHLQPLFKDTTGARLTGVAKDLFDRGLCLPSGTSLENSDIIRITNIIKRELGNV